MQPDEFNELLDSIFNLIFYIFSLIIHILFATCSIKQRMLTFMKRILLGALHRILVAVFPCIARVSNKRHHA